jgi:DNA topoisomerase-1
MGGAADRLGNTAAVTRGSYVHPAVVEAYLDGEIADGGRRPAEPDEGSSSLVGSGEERAVRRLIRRRAGPSPGSG